MFGHGVQTCILLAMAATSLLESEHNSDKTTLHYNRHLAELIFTANTVAELPQAWRQILGSAPGALKPRDNGNVSNSFSTDVTQIGNDDRALLSDFRRLLSKNHDAQSRMLQQGPGSGPPGLGSGPPQGVGSSSCKPPCYPSVMPGIPYIVISTETRMFSGSFAQMPSQFPPTINICAITDNLDVQVSRDMLYSYAVTFQMRALSSPGVRYVNQDLFMGMVVAWEVDMNYLILVTLILYSRGCRLFIGPANFDALQTVALVVNYFFFDAVLVTLTHPHPQSFTSDRVYSMEPTMMRSMLTSLDTVLQSSKDQPPRIQKMAAVTISSTFGQLLGNVTAGWAISNGFASSNVTIHTVSSSLDIDAVVDAWKNSSQPPELVVLCVSTAAYPTGWSPGVGSVCNLLESSLRRADFSPKAVVFPPYCIGTWTNSHTNRHYSQGFVGAEPWVPTMNSTSNMGIAGTTSMSFYSTYLSQWSLVPSGFSALAFSAVDFLLHMLDSVTTPDLGGQSPNNLTNVGLAVLKTIKRFGSTNSLKNMRTLIGSMDFSNYRRSQPFIAVQWQQASTYAATGWSHTSTTAIVGPKQSPYGNFWQNYIWYPKPTYLELECITTDPAAGVMGYPPQNVSYCGNCSSGMISYLEHKNFSKFDNHLFGVHVCKNCPAGKRMWQLNGVGHCSDCMAGTFSERPGALLCTACSSGSYQPQSSASGCILCSPGFYEDVSSSTACSACPQGRIALHSGNAECIPCPTGASCASDGASFQSLDLNYFISAQVYKADEWPLVPAVSKMQGGELYRCPYKEGKVCKAGNICEYKGLPNAQRGPLCGTCEKGHEKAHYLEACKKCPNSFVVFCMCFLNVLWISLFTSFTVAEAYNTGHGVANQVRVVIYKQLINYAIMTQSLLEIADIQLGDTDSFLWLSDFLGWTKFLGYKSPAKLEQATACQLHIWAPDTKTVYSMIVMAHLMIPAWLLASFILFSIVRGFVNFLTVYSISLQTPLSAMWNITMYLVHIRTTKMLRDVFICRTFDGSRLMASPEVFCDDTVHRRWMLLAGIGIAVWSIGIPFVFLYLLVSTKRSGRLYKRSTRKVLGFFYVGFKPAFYFMEPIHMLRAVAFQLVPCFEFMQVPMLPVGKPALIGAGPVSGALFIVLVVFANHLHSPYDMRQNDILNRIERAALWGVLTTAFGSYLKLALDSTEMVRKGSLLSNSITVAIVAVVLVMHARLLLLALHGVIFQLIRDAFTGPELRTLKLHTTGVFVKDMKRKHDKKLFCKIVEHMARLTFSRREEVRLVRFAFVLQRLMFETAYWVERRANDKSFKTPSQKFADTLSKKAKTAIDARTTASARNAIERTNSDALTQSGASGASRSPSSVAESEDTLGYVAEDHMHKKMSVNQSDFRSKMNMADKMEDVSRFVGSFLTCADVYQVALQHGSHIIEESLSRFDAMSVEARTRNPQQAEDGEDGVEYDISRHSFGDAQVFEQLKVKQVIASETAEAYRDVSEFGNTCQTRKEIQRWRKYRQLLLHTSGLLRSLGCNMGSYGARDAYPKTIGINVEIHSVNGVRDPMNGIFCVCTVIDESDQPRGFCQTLAAQSDTDTFTWNYKQWLADFKTGDAIEFTLYRQDDLFGDTSSPGTLIGYGIVCTRDFELDWPRMLYDKSVDILHLGLDNTQTKPAELSVVLTPTPSPEAAQAQITDQTNSGIRPPMLTLAGRAPASRHDSQEMAASDSQNDYTHVVGISETDLMTRQAMSVQGTPQENADRIGGDMDAIQSYQLQVQQLKEDLKQMKLKVAQKKKSKEQSISQIIQSTQSSSTRSNKHTQVTHGRAKSTRSSNQIQEYTPEEIARQEIEQHRTVVEETRGRLEDLKCELEWVRNSLSEAKSKARAKDSGQTAV